MICLFSSPLSRRLANMICFKSIVPFKPHGAYYPSSHASFIHETNTCHAYSFTTILLPGFSRSDRRSQYFHTSHKFSSTSEEAHPLIISFPITHFFSFQLFSSQTSVIMTQWWFSIRVLASVWASDQVHSFYHLMGVYDNLQRSDPLWLHRGGCCWYFHFYIIRSFEQLMRYG